MYTGIEGGRTQSTGRALGLEKITSQLEILRTKPGEAEDEASELWTDVFQPLKEGRI